MASRIHVLNKGREMNNSVFVLDHHS